MRYDVGVSYSGKQLPYVQEVVTKLENDGFRVFFDRNCPDELLGEYLPSAFAKLYGKDFRFAAVFISRDYSKSPFCRAELEACVARNLRSRQAYLLPLRFDKTEIKPLNKLYGYADISHMASGECAELISSKIAWNIDTIRLNGLLATDRYEEAERRLLAAYRSRGRLAKRNHSFVLYNLACTCGIIALRLYQKGDRSSSEIYLDRCFNYYSSWFEGELFQNVGWTGNEAIAFTDKDADLYFLRKKRTSALSQLRQRLGYEQRVGKAKGGGGCVLDDTIIDTPTGGVASQSVQLFSTLTSLDPLNGWQPTIAKITRIMRSTSNEWFGINELRCSPAQRLRDRERGWIEAQNVKPGMNLLTGAGTYEKVLLAEQHEESVPVTIYETDHPSHNFIASGLLCHNMKF